MPIKSFIVFPSPGQKEPLQETLSKITGCSIVPSENKEVFVLVTDTQTEKEEETLLTHINELEAVDQLSMVAGYNENQI